MAKELRELYNQLANCPLDCPLKSTTVPVKGCYPEKKTNICFVGEAPGARETELGTPFVGTAGNNFIEFLHQLNLKREEIFITNTVKCRPTVGYQGKKNRAPYAAEIKTCFYYLQKELEIMNPKLIITLGNIPLKALLGDNKASINAWHGTLFFYGAAKVFPLHHPGAVTYNKNLSSVIARDLKVLKQLVALQK